MGELWRRIEAGSREATRTDLRSVCLYRFLFVGFTVFFYWPSFRWIGDVPQSFFAPPPVSLGALAGGFPPDAVLAGYQFQFSFGKIDHNMLYLCVLPVMG